MPAALATIVFALLILALFRLDRDRTTKVSATLWIPIVWVLIGASRMVSQWLGSGPTLVSPDQYLDGSPLDRVIFSGLILSGLLVVLRRGQRSGAFLRSNGPLLALFIYGGVSILWSDFPEVAFKRWIKFLGNFIMVLVVLTDPNPSAAVKSLLARTGFLLIPLSVLLIKYYPELGRSYDPWTYKPFFNGVAAGKNSLGIICLIFGLGSLWRVLEAFKSAEKPWLSGPLIAHGAILIMVLWLFGMANSSTSTGCFLVGMGLLLLTSLRRKPLSPMAIHLILAGIVSVALFGLFIDANAGLIEVMGREATLAGRTELWEELLRMNNHPWFGSGFESFWLGEQAKDLWEHHWWHPNQAHNGYIEILLNQGWIGIGLFAVVFAWGYRNALNSLHADGSQGRIRLAYFVIVVLYSLTEAAFKSINPIWVIFLLAIVVLPKDVDGSAETLEYDGNFHGAQPNERTHETAEVFREAGYLHPPPG